VLGLYWREPGTLDQTVRDLEKSMSACIRLTGGQGAGAASALKAEVMLMRGRDEQAEILCHKALYEARNKQQVCICLCAELTLARVAILRGDADAYFAAMENIQRYARENPSPYILRMVDLCFFVISVTLGKKDGIPKWFSDAQSIEKNMYAPAASYAHMFYSGLLLDQNRRPELYGLSPLLLETAQNRSSIQAQLYQHIVLSVANYRDGDFDASSAHLNEALALALPDKGYLPFSLEWDTLDFVLSGAQVPPELLALRKRQRKGVAAIISAMQQHKPSLPGGRHFALLA
jgi:LuxR family maltose regulon positive regulatory protein